MARKIIRQKSSEKTPTSFIWAVLGSLTIVLLVIFVLCHRAYNPKAPFYFY